MAFELEGLDLRHAAAPGQQTLPDFGSGLAYSAEKADAGYNDAPLGVR
jgi:hypothetical protein